jgi:hypothetical protein
MVYQSMMLPGQTMRSRTRNNTSNRHLEKFDVLPLQDEEIDQTIVFSP